MSEPVASTAKYSEEFRLIRIKTQLDSDDNQVCLLEKFTATESLSKPFEFQVEMLSTKQDIDMKSLLRTPATITVMLYDDTERNYNAVFSSLRQIGATEQDLVYYVGTMVPNVWFLALDSNCMIFQNLSVPDIVKQVLGAASISDYSFVLDESKYTAREYCVQYRESSLNFINRLLEEEGIFYYFDHTADKNTIVFADDSKTVSACPGQAIAKYAYNEEGWLNEKADAIIGLQRIEQAYTGKVKLADYNFTTPAADLTASLGKEFEQFYDYPGEYLDLDAGDSYSSVRLDELESNQFLIEGRSRCRSFRPGYSFTLQDHFRTDTNQEYFITSVTHNVLDTTYTGGKGDVADYKNTFTAIPKTVAYRPPRITRRPFVRGSQTALVVGPSGEEIWVDNYGRVKVQFYWDQIGAKDENSSCFVRVSQIWAGKNWGWVTIPRIGQEVIVDFLEGDPDRPLITGRVYNADQMPPYTLPDNQTQSGIKSRSSKQGTAENYNEIRFEDLKDSEMITIHAEKDMETTVENNDTQTIQNNRTIEVDGTHTEKIVKDTTITITEGNHSLTLNQGNQSITLDQGNQTTTLSVGNQSITLSLGSQTTNVDAGSISTKAALSITLTVEGSSISITPEGITISLPW